ncbi:NADH dehydrogenase [Galliscardovia ingluviei]|uniref:NADH dehydrogenase n=1 Tax=Galliscardovia ingluviei TaxID=1769422 RepID=A0A8J3AF18_9BIFI|nr:NAD(P)/FAD-dependent oxidoreductase [Galliscardovia ingluviei]GGI13182.1 NADH dehydrogenase [Galliscardovia ingluviei]
MKEILVLGAGYAGLKTVRNLQKQQGDFHITLVDRNDFHYEAAELHEVAAGSQPRTKITFPIQEVLNDKTTFVQDEVVTIDRDAQKVTLRNHDALHYDYLVIALGFVSETFGIPGAAEHALQMVTIPTAERIHEHIVETMKHYRQSHDPNDLRLLVCGAGFTGIELAGALTDERKKYAELAGVAPEQIEIVCVEAATRILPMFDDELAQYGLQLIEKLGIKLMTGCKIKGINPGEVLYTAGDDEQPQTIKAGTIIWTTGVSGSPVMGESGFSQRRGRVIVNDDLTDQEHKNVYIIGDVSAFMDKQSNRPYPTTAQIASRMGAHVAKNLAHQLRGEATEPFSFVSQGTVASVGNTHAFGVVGKTKVKGYPASAIKKMIRNKSLNDLGGLKEVLSLGCFDLYH